MPDCPRHELLEVTGAIAIALRNELSRLTTERAGATERAVGQLFACRSCRVVEFRRPGRGAIVADLRDSPLWNRWG